MNNLVGEQSSPASVEQLLPNEAQRKDTSTLAAGASISLIGKLSGRGLNVLGQVLLARFLGPELFGLYAIGLNFLNALGLIAPLGLDKGTIRFGSRYVGKSDPNLKSAILKPLVMALVSGFTLATIVIVAAPRLEEAFDKPGLDSILRIMIIALPLMAGLYVAAAATTISKKTRYSALARDLAQPIVGLLLIVTFYLLGWGLQGAVTAIVLSFAAALFLAIYYLRRLFPEIFRRQPKSQVGGRELLIFSVPTTMAAVFTNLTSRIDRLLVGYFRPAAEVGVYQAVAQTAIFFTTIMGSFNAIFMPMIADLYHKQETERLNELFKVATKWELYISIPVYLTMLFVPKEIIITVFGREYVSGSIALMILGTAQFVNVATGAVGPILIMTGHQTRWLRISATTLVVNIGLNLLLVPRFGLIGSALASLAAITLLFGAGLYVVRQTLHLWPYDRRYLKGLLAAGVTAAFLALLTLLPIQSATIRLFIAMALSVGIFTLVLLLQGLDEEDLDFIQLLLSRLGKSESRLGKRLLSRRANKDVQMK